MFLAISHCRPPINIIIKSKGTLVLEGAFIVFDGPFLFVWVVLL